MRIVLLTNEQWREYEENNLNIPGGLVRDILFLFLLGEIKIT